MKIDSTQFTMVLCCGAMMCLAISTNLPPVFLTTFGETFGGNEGLSGEQLGRIPAILFMAMVFGIVMTGPLADRWGAKLFVLSGLGWIILGLGMLGGATNYALLLLAVGLMGFGAANLEVVLSPIIAAVRPHRRASALNRLHLFYCVGAVGTVMVGAAALHAHVSWRLICLIMMTLPILICCGFVLIRPPALTQENAPQIPFSSLIRRPFLYAAALAILLGGATEVGLVQWLPAFAERGLGYSKAVSGTALAVFSVAMATGRFVTARIVHHTGIFPILIGSCIASVLLVGIAAFCSIAPIALLACVCIGFSVASLWPSTLAVAADHIPRGGASMFAVLAATGNIGCVAMPWLIGFLAERTDLKYGIFATGLCPLILVFIFMGMRYMDKRHQLYNSPSTMLLIKIIGACCMTSTASDIPCL
ncbi:MAG: MFS transporter [Candidatus Omnitrophota bacterium]|nr:MAG: MFS transporter [Candidatus Omnitrophota bacterium]